MIIILFLSLKVSRILNIDGAIIIIAPHAPTIIPTIINVIFRVPNPVVANELPCNYNIHSARQHFAEIKRLEIVPDTRYTTCVDPVTIR